MLLQKLSGRRKICPHLDLFGCLLVKAVKFQCRSQHLVKLVPANNEISPDLLTFQWLIHLRVDMGGSFPCILVTLMLHTKWQCGTIATAWHPLSSSLCLHQGKRAAPVRGWQQGKPNALHPTACALTPALRDRLPPVTPSHSCPLPSDLVPLSISLCSHVQPLDSPEHPLVFPGGSHPQPRSFVVHSAMNSSHPERWLAFCPHSRGKIYILLSKDVANTWKNQHWDDKHIYLNPDQGYLEKDKVKLRGARRRSEGPVEGPCCDRVTPTQRAPLRWRDLQLPLKDLVPRCCGSSQLMAQESSFRKVALALIPQGLDHPCWPVHTHSATLSPWKASSKDQSASQ